MTFEILVASVLMKLANHLCGFNNILEAQTHNRLLIDSLFPMAQSMLSLIQQNKKRHTVFIYTIVLCYDEITNKSVGDLMKNTYKM